MHFAKKYSATTGQMPHFMETSTKPILLFGEDELTSLQQASHASQPALPDSDVERRTTVGTGLRLARHITNVGPAESFLKTLLASSAFWNRAVLLRWKQKRLSCFTKTKITRSRPQSFDYNSESLDESLKSSGRMDMYYPNIPTERQSFFVFQLVPWERPTVETGFGLLLTPTVHDHKSDGPKILEEWQTEAAKGKRPKTSAQRLRNQVQFALLPTPTSDTDRKQKYAQGGTSLPTALSLRPTPQSRDFRSPDKPESNNFQRKVREGYTIDLNSAIAMLPTPATRDYKGTNSDEHLGKERGHHDQLPNAMKMSTGLKLQPAFAAWMMGYPEDWTLTPFLLDPNTPPENGEKNPSKATETPSSPKSPTLSTKPSKPPK
jgi:hypothetical protein